MLAHICPACQSPHHWLQNTCTDAKCPWGHSQLSYGRLIEVMGNCLCTFEAVTETLVAISPRHWAAEDCLVETPCMAICSNNGELYQPSADEWLHILGAVVDDQRGGFGQGQVWQNYLADLREAYQQRDDILSDEAWMSSHPGR